MRRPLRPAALLALLLSCAPALSADPVAGPAPAVAEPPAPVIAPVAPLLPPPTGAAEPGVRNGREIYASFVEGLADTDCGPTDVSARWRRHFAHVPGQLNTRNNDVLPLFGYVVDALRAAHLPTEYALIPFVESGYRPGARSASGPAGMWQFIAVTARNHKIAIRPGYDGRLSPVEATTAAVRYLKTLHGMFAGDWRLAVMAFNAGEYRVLGALKRHGQRPASAEPAQLSSLAGITQAYVRKLHALSCLMLEADDSDAWLQALDRPVPRLVGVDLPAGTRSLDAFAARHGIDPVRLRRLNPAFADGRVASPGRGLTVLAPAMPSPVADVDDAPPAAPPATTAATAVAN